MTPKVMKQIMGDVPITTFHNLDWFAIQNQLPKVLGTKKSISTYTGDTSGTFIKRWWCSNQGGVVWKWKVKYWWAEQRTWVLLLMNLEEDGFSPEVLGKILGMKELQRVMVVDRNTKNNYIRLIKN